MVPKLHEPEFEAYLRKREQSRRDRVEKELHRIEEYALRRLESLGLNIVKKSRLIPIANGPSIRFSLSEAGNFGPTGSISPALWRRIKDKQRKCRYTYGDEDLWPIAYEILTNKRAAQADQFAASVVLRLPEMWVDFSLSDAESLELVTAFIDIASYVPTPEAHRWIVMEAKSGAMKLARSKQQEPFEKVKNFLVKKAQTEWLDDSAARINSLAEYYHQEIDFAKFGLTKKPTIDTIKRWIKPYAPPAVRLPGRRRKS